MNPFRYVRASDPQNAIQRLAADAGARFIAGGTTILDLMKSGVEQPSLLVDVNGVADRRILRRGDEIEIGALARMSDVAGHPEIVRHAPMVASALQQSASVQLRNMASIGGNLLQRTRCSYFRDVAAPCNKRHRGEGCSAIGGENRRHAILGGSEDCICVHASDLAVALAAAGATIHTMGPGGAREIPITDFYLLPRDTANVETALHHAELIAAVTLPLDAALANSTYVKVRDRADYDFALLSVAAGLEIEAGTVRAARLALGGVAPIPWRVPEAEAVLVGHPATPASYREAAEVALRGARGYGGNDFKVTLARNALVRALEDVGSPE
ncbi:MAG TPA: xanthine dehydrogenase family protein subunit M [Candidatus Tyrphobacter sp.]